MYAIYTRQSIDKPDSISTESQIEFCLYEVRGSAYREYTDKGYSGKNTDRPQFRQLIEDIKKGEIKKVVVYKLDRISRSILDFSNMMELFQKYNVEFISFTEKFDTSTPMGRAMLNICIVFAQLERETIQKRVTDAYLSRSQKGFYMGGRVPYGFTIKRTEIQGIKTSMYVIEPEEAKHIELMYQIYSEPQTSYGYILNVFEEHNIINLRTGKKWERTRVADHLKNPIYVQADEEVYQFYKSQGVEIVNDRADFIGANGCYYYRGQNAKGRKHVELAGNVLVLAPHEGLIPPDVWLKCRIKCLKNKQIQPGRRIVNTWLAGKIKCINCGYALSRKQNKNSTNAYYLCSRRMNSKACNGCGTIYANQFEDLIFQEMKKKLEEFQTLTAHHDMKKNPKEIALQSELLQVEQEIKKLLENVSSANGVLMKYINDKITELDTKKKNILNELTKATITDKTTGKDIDKITGYMDKWQEITIDDKRIVCDCLIEVIRASSDEVQITWKI